MVRYLITCLGLLACAKSDSTIPASDASGDGSIADVSEPPDGFTGEGRAAVDGGAVEDSSADAPTDTATIDAIDRPDVTASDGGPACPGTGLARAAFFNQRPAGGGPGTELEDLVVDLLQCAPAGSRVRASYFNLSRIRVAEAFLAAAARGVRVQMVLDGDNRNAAGERYPAVAMLQAALGADLVLCGDSSGGSCIGTNINHNKFMLIDSLSDGSTNVILQSSANLTGGQLSLHNNSVVIRGDRTLFDGFAAYFADLQAQVPNPDYHRRIIGDDAVRAWFFPQETGDTIVSVIDNITCIEGSRIRLAMSLFAAGRSDVASALVRRRREGCAVQALLRGDDEAPPASIVNTLVDGGVSVVSYPVDPVDGWNIHSKYLLVSAGFGSAPDVMRRLVFTGSHNYTTNALRNNDEVLLRIEDNAVFDAFRLDWLAIRDAAR